MKKLCWIQKKQSEGSTIKSVKDTFNETTLALYDINTKITHLKIANIDEEVRRFEFWHQCSTGCFKKGTRTSSFMIILVYKRRML